jgi:hypothetical protein
MTQQILLMSKNGLPGDCQEIPSRQVRIHARREDRAT